MNRNFSKLAVPMGVVGIVLLLVVPIPAVLLDILIIINIVFALLVLMNSMFVKKPLDFSVFPSLLLVATLFRLGLNVASTRLVLGQAHAGQVIQAFGQVTVGGNLIIGGVIFLILVVIQFVVVTKGAERVAEVGARFTLDAMPGKQMAIDADLNAGLISDVEAKERRAEVSAEADFYGGDPVNPGMDVPTPAEIVATMSVVSIVVAAAWAPEAATRVVPPTTARRVTELPA